MLLLATGVAQAQTDSNDPASGDPPARVARLSYAQGDLGLLPAGSTEWSAADINRPLTNGDKLSGGPGARAELDLGGAALRINGQTDIGVLNLNGQIGQFELTQGTLSITVQSLDEGATYEIDTPTLALVINQPGTFRIDVGPNGNGSTVTVFGGGGIVYGENNAQRQVFSGRSYAFTDSSLNGMTVSQIDSRDEFDAWCNDRDAQYANTANAQYVSNDVVGGQDLNQYGDWEEDDDYGAVWYPAGVAVGWAPYTFGHWVWIGPWGWTWVDGMPWGFAPYHYGRWAFLHDRWGWMPGPRGVRSIYAPALVAFVGIGRGGPVGWFPLGPHEVYNPWYHASRGYYANVNTSNIAIGRGYNHAALVGAIDHQYGFYRAGRPVTGVNYVNRDVPHAFTAVSAQAFASARNVQGNQMHMDARQVAGAAVVSPASLQRPSPASFGQPRVAHTHPLPAAGFSRPVVAVNAPAAAMAANTARPAANVRVLQVQPNAAPRVVSGQAFPHYATPEPHQATLPQVPHFAPAQQIQQAPHYAPTPSIESEQQRFEAAERAHQYVPQEQARPYEPNPSYEPMRPSYQPPVYAHPEMGRPQPQSHPQSAPPHPHSSPPARDDNKH
ncbi:hypothetical protein DWU98_07480 [Dyella monticola]|uniref:FecR protein domain-containing protein n=1 Tax=Dyella monticola TaxID=1927958 RepID=A0A370X3V0_9GAMM|nr:hypothetical protein DWU98_07480 [Dyella monticola]